MNPRMGAVTIVGRPNSGKSTLLNRVMDAQVSIVSRKPQTTRDEIRGILTEPKHGQIIFLDTPGIHRAREGGLNAYMMDQVKKSLEAPDLVWYLVDPRSKPEPELQVLEQLALSHAPVYLLWTKGDTGRPPIPFKDTLREEILARKLNLTFELELSARTGKGIEALMEQTWRDLPEGTPLYPDPDILSDRPARFIVAEKIREQLFHCLGEELPYSCAVLIENYNERIVPLRIEAKIVVERESQKGMVVGHGGAKIKEIGIRARKQIEEFLGQKIFLGLKVEVLKNWTKDRERLKSLGYEF